MKNFMLIKRVSAFLYVGYAENVQDIPRLMVEQFDVEVPDPEPGFDPYLSMKARCIYHLPHNCFLIRRVEDVECSETSNHMQTHCAHNHVLFQKSAHGREQSAVEALLNELHDAEIQHPSWPEEAVHAAAIVVEEAGELLRDTATYEENGDAKLITNMQIEAVQTGAMALRFLKNLPTSQKRTIPHSALRSVLDSDLTPEQQLAEVRRLVENGVS